MSKLVLKFGGTSVSDVNRIIKAADIAAQAANCGHQVTVVVSAMGHTTDHLIDLAEQITDTPNSREMDMLLATGEQMSIALMTMALQSLGHKARSFTGAQAGIQTEDIFGSARIVSIKPDFLNECLQAGEIAVVAGFQGATSKGEITTLGRGGSDTTAVALAAALQASCDIYTDVDGIYTADPRLLSEARRLEAISYEEMLILARSGAQVMAARAVELASKQGVPIRVRSTFKPQDQGTLISYAEHCPSFEVCGLAVDMGRCFVSLALNTGIEPTIVEDILTTVEKQAMGIELVSMRTNQQPEGKETDLCFAIERKSSGKIKNLLSSYGNNVVIKAIESDVAKITLAGRSLSFATIEDAVVILSNSAITIHHMKAQALQGTFIIPAGQAREAVKILHDHFGKQSSAVIDAEEPPVLIPRSFPSINNPPLTQVVAETIVSPSLTNGILSELPYSISSAYPTETEHVIRQSH